MHFIFKQLVFAAFCSLTAFSVTGRAAIDTVFFNKSWKVCARDSAVYFRPSPSFADGLYAVKDYYMSGQLQMTGAMSSLTPETKEGRFLFYGSDGQVESRESFRHNRNADTSYIYKSGLLRRRIVFLADTNYSQLRIYDTLNGVSQREGLLYRGLETGEWRQYSTGGRLTATLNYAGGKLEGCVRLYDTTYGSVRSEHLLLGDSLYTISRYTPGGRIFMEIPIAHGRKNGILRCYDTLTGYLRYTKTIRNDSMTGPAEYYNSNCELIRNRYNLVNDTAEGESREFHQCSDKLHSIAYWKHGRRDGTYTAFDQETGNIIVEGEERDNLEEGEWRYYFARPAKKLRQIKTYKHGKLDGPLTTWWSNGKLRRQEQYEDGTRSSWKCFAQNASDTLYYPHYTPPEFLKDPQYYFDQWVVYPEVTGQERLSGKVTLRLRMEIDKSISYAAIVASDNPIFNNEARRIAYLLPVVTPGMEDGIPIYADFKLAVHFKAPE